MLCPLCESQNPDSSLRCRACGAKLGARETVAQSDSPDALPVGTVLGRLYDVEGVLGQGGFGITYRCRDQMLERAVAVKEFFPSNSRRVGAQVEPGRGFSSDEFREARAQFLIEARLLARCHHPGVVTVHTAFEENGTAYMVMELLHGQNLMQAMDSRAGNWSEEEALAPIERVGQALQYVHDQGLLHRDIKPENIVLCDDGRVMLLDFGTAREYAQGQSQRHTVAVTPGFAPLEQYAKQAKRGAFTDVYGLAATLYYLLTGAPPPAASDRAMGVVVRPVREQNPRVSEGVARAVEAGLHMEIARRPQSVRAFLALLRAPASEKPANETPTLAVPSLTEAESEVRLGDAITDFLSPQRFPTPTATTPFAPVALRPRDSNANTPSVLRSSSASPTSSSIPATSYKPNWTPPNSGDGIGVQDLDDRSGATFGWFIGLGILFIIFLAFASSQSSRTPSPPIPVVSPNYRPPLNPPPGVGSSSPDSSSGISPASVQDLPVSAKSENAASDFSQRGWAEFSQDGKWVAYRDAENVVRVWDRRARRVVRTMSQEKNRPVIEINFSGTGNFLALTHLDRSAGGFGLDVWNFQTGTMIGKLDSNWKTRPFLVHGVRPDGQVLLGKFPSNKNNSRTPVPLFWWNPRNGKKTLLVTLQGISEYRQAALSPDGKKLCVGDGSGQVSWFDATTGALKAQIDSADPNALLPVEKLRFSSNGSFLVGQTIGKIRVFDRNSQEIGNILAPYPSTVAVSPDGRSVIEGRDTVTLSKTVIRLLAVSSGQQTLLLMPGHQGRFEGALSFSPDGKQVQCVLSSYKGTSLYTWNVGGQNQVVAVPSSDDKSLAAYSLRRTTSFEVAPNAMLAMSNKFIASSAGDFAEIRDQNGSFLKQFPMNSGMGTTTRTSVLPDEFALSPDGQMLGVRNPTGKTQVWKVESKESPISFAAFPPRQSNENSPNQNKDIIFSPDNRLAALVGIKKQRGFNEVVELWDLQDVPRRIALIGQEAPVSSLAFSPDNATLLVGHQGGSLQWVGVKAQHVVALSSTRDPSETSVLALLSSNKGLLVAKRTGATLTLVRYAGTKSWPQGPIPRMMPSPARQLFPNKIIGDVAVFSPDGRLLAVPMRIGGNSIGLWDAATGSFLRSLPVGGTQGDGWLRTASITFSPDGKRISCLKFNLQTNRTEVLNWERSSFSSSEF